MWFFRADHVEDDDFIFARAQPAAGRVGRLRRADVPVAAEAMAVDPHIALAPVVQIQKRVAGFFQRERAAPEGRSALHPALVFGLAESKFQARQHLVIQRQIENFPAFQNFAAKFHRRDQAFAVGHFRAEIDAAHRLDENVQLRFLVAFRQDDFRRRAAAVQNADAFAVEEHVAEIVDGRRFERGRRARRNFRAIQNAAVALVVGFHVARRFVLHRRRQIVENRRDFFQFHRRKR